MSGIAAGRAEARQPLSVSETWRLRGLLRTEGMGYIYTVGRLPPVFCSKTLFSPHQHSIYRSAVVS